MKCARILGVWAALAASSMCFALPGALPTAARQDDKAEAWAKRLAEYQPDTKAGSKGEFGIPSMDGDQIIRVKPLYLEAKKLYEEFLAAKIDPDSHWMLRDAAWQVQTGLKTYLQSIATIHEEAAANINQGASWIASQKTKPKPLIHGSWRMEGMGEAMRRLRRLLDKDDARLVELEKTWAALTADQEQLEQATLKARKMKPDLYKGGDAQAVKQLAAKIIDQDAERRYEEFAEKPPIKVLRAHITSATWDTESAVEWTDSTQSALQYRVSKGLFVQAACQVGDRFFLYTLYIHRDRVGGETGSLIGHVMYRDRFLKENIPS